MYNKLINRINEEKGNAVIVLGLILIIAVLLIGGMMLDISKAYQMKHSYINAARKATQTAIREQSSSGYLNNFAITEAIRVYENINRPSIIKEGFLSNCEGVNRNVSIEILLRKDEFSNPVSVATILSKSITSSDDRESVNAKLLSQITEVTDADKFTGIEMKLTESTPNIILPGAFGLSGGVKDNIKCQLIGVSAGASQFIGEDEADGKFD